MAAAGCYAKNLALAQKIVFPTQGDCSPPADTRNVSHFTNNRVSLSRSALYTGLLLDPWWIAAIVAACLIALVIIVIICMCMCRWNMVNSGAWCYDPEFCWRCCVTLRCDADDQPYRRRRRRPRRHIRSEPRCIDRPRYAGTIYTFKLTVADPGTAGGGIVIVYKLKEQ